MRKKTAKALALLVCMGISLPAMATVILDWSAADAMSTATGDIAINLGTPTDQGDIKNIVPGSPIMSTAWNSEYTENDVYGVIQTQNPGADTVDLDTAGSGMDQSTPGLWIGVDGNVPSPPADSIRNIAALISIDLDVAAGASDYITAMSFSTQGGGGIGDVGVSFAIESGGNWYISSQTTFETDTGLVINYDGSDFAQLTVATASSTSLMTGAALTYDQDVTSLDNITSVGVFFEGSSPNETARARIKLDGLTAEVIPEPATLGLVGIGGGALIFIRRRLKI